MIPAMKLSLSSIPTESIIHYALAELPNYTQTLRIAMDQYSYNLQFTLLGFLVAEHVGAGDSI
jgi:hypothetical protein